MTEPAATIQLEEVAYGVDRDDRDALAAELRAVADGAPRLYPGVDLAEALERGGVIVPDGRAKYALFRALNHLTRRQQSPGLITIRDTLTGNAAVKPRSYRIRRIGGAGAKAEEFVSYGANYERGDRLVTRDDVFRVVDVDGVDPPVLEVERWRPNHPVQVPSFVFDDTRGPIQLISMPPPDGVAVAGELATYDDDAAWSAGQKIMAAMDLPTVSTDIRLTVHEWQPVLRAVETLHGRGGLSDDPERLIRELRSRIPA